MANTILHKRSATPSAAPTTGDLSLGELALNTYDGKLFFKKDDGSPAIVEVSTTGHNHDAAYISIVGSPTSGNFPTLTAGGELANSVYSPSSFAAAGHNHDADYISIVSSPTLDNFVKLTAGGELVDAGVSSSSFATAGHNHDSTYLALTGGTLTGALTLNADPTNALHAATKQYVDAVAVGLRDFKNSVRVASTANIDLATGGLLTIDGVSLSTDDRVLVKNQSTASENGIYLAKSGSWVRATDADSSAEVTAGMFMMVTEGTTYADTQWVLSTNDPITLDTTSLVFTQFGAPVIYTAGTGIDVTGTVISIANHSAAYVTSGTMSGDRVSGGTFGAVNGSALTNLNATNISTGTLDVARLPATVVLDTETIDGGSF